MRYFILLLILPLAACFEADQRIVKDTDLSDCRREANGRAPLKPSETGNDLNAELRETLMAECLEERGYTVGSTGADA